MRKYQNGFTLIELIVVISIVLITISFLFPKYAGYQKKAKTVKAINTAHVIQNAAIAAMDDSDIEKTIKELTGAQIVSVSQDNQANLMTIVYKSDGEDYNLVINMQDTSYAVQKGNDKIYDTNAVSTANSTN